MYPIDRNNPTPLYEQLKIILRNKIMHNEYKPGDSLPTEKELCNQFNISRITVRKAIDDLDNDCLIQKTQGKKSIVRYSSHEVIAHEVIGFTEIIGRLGLQTHSRILIMESINGNPELLSDFELPVNQAQHFTHVRRLRFINDIPMLIQDTYITEELGEKLKSFDLGKASFFNLYEKILNRKLVRNVGTLIPKIIDDESAHLLQVDKKSAHFLLKTKTYSEGNLLIEVAEGLYNVDLFEFTGARYQLSERGMNFNPNSFWRKKITL